MNADPRKNITMSEWLAMEHEFKEYLDRTGTLEAILIAIESLSTEPVLPENPIDYIRKQLAIHCGAPDRWVELEETVEKLDRLVNEMHEQNRRIARNFVLEAEARKRKEKAAKECSYK